MGSTLDLEDMLNDRWLDELADTIKEQPRANYFLSRNRPADMVPLRELTFRSLIHHNDPSKWRVIIFGQAPYPRVESATGIGCCDGKITSWNQPLSPTLRNTIKNALVGEGHLRKDENVGALRSKLRQLDIVQPMDWFQHTIEQGVMWLNASLTLKRDDATAKHTKFWAPIIEKIMQVIITAKSALREGHKDRATVIVLWGGHAKKLWRMVERVNRDRIPIRTVEAHNPAVEKFQESTSFREINTALSSMGSDTINFLPSTNDMMRQYSIPRPNEAERRAETVEEAAEVLQAATHRSLRVRLAMSRSEAEEAGDLEEGERDEREERRPMKRLRRMADATCEEAEDGENACVVCLSNKINCVLLSCGHLACCMDCAERLDKCPMCRAHVWKKVRTFSAY